MSPQQLIAHYRILSKLGEGGMGEVWRATDTKLGREVALKILPEAFATDVDRMARFEREAHVLASLNHPNIATIYGVEDRAIVMELVEGPTLADRIAEGPIGFDEAIAIARQMGDALEAAHEKGVVHRDLKPANVKVTPQGRVKVLDFGLAKAMTEEVSTGNPSMSPTMTMRATVAGVILGTAAYMSPEQARGKAVDKRADIWSFGVVLYEMFTGRMLFHGETVSDTLAAVLTREPEWDRVPAKARRLLRKCLEKDPTVRLRDIGDAWELLEDASAPALPQSKLPWTVAGVTLLIAAGAVWFGWRATRPVERTLQPLVRLDVDLGRDVSLNLVAGPNVILSPNGTRLVYESQHRLYTRRLDQPKAIELAGTEGAFSPFFSPDGQWVAFFAQGKLKKVSVEAGSPISLCDANTGIPTLSGSWGEDGNIIALLGLPGGLSRISSAGGGKPTPVTEAQNEGHNWPQVLPGDKAVLFAAGRRFGQRRIDVLSFADGRRKTVLPAGNFARYLRSGHLMYLNQGDLFAVPFDLKGLEVRGAPVQVVAGVANNAVYGSAQFDISLNGTMVYQRGRVDSGLVTVHWLDAAGSTQALLAKPSGYQRPRLSPDGKRLALTIADETGPDVWVYEWQRETPTRLTLDGTSDGPVWTPDGRYVVFSRHGGSRGIYWMRSDGVGKPQLLVQTNDLSYPSSFTAGQKRLAYYERNSTSKFDLWTVSLESDSAGLRAGKPEFFLQTPADERHQAFSPDGHWLAYSSDESGTFEVYVQAVSDKRRWRISNSGGMYPMWSRDSRELFFRTEEHQIMVAAYAVKGDSFQPEKPRIWSEKRLANVGQAATYDVAADGKRIVAILPGVSAEQKADHHVIFLLNFFDELRRRVPVGGK
jgi:predicted Ser/Thr protein kinase